MLLEQIPEQGLAARVRNGVHDFANMDLAVLNPLYVRAIIGNLDAVRSVLDPSTAGQERPRSFGFGIIDRGRLGDF